MDRVTTLADDDQDGTPRHGPRQGGTAILALANLLAQGINFFWGLVLARLLPVEGRGEVALVTAYDDVSSNVFSFGVPAAVGYASKERHASDGALLGAAARYGFIALPISVVAGAAAYVWPLAHLPETTRWIGFYLVAASPLMNTFFMSCRNLVTARGDLRGLAIASVSQVSARLALLLAIAVVGSVTSFTGAVTLAASTVVANVVIWHRTRTRVEAPAPLGGLLRYGIRTVPGALSNMANSRLDQLLIAPLLGSSALGIYAVAVSVNYVPVNVGISLGLGSFSRIRADAGDAGRAAAAAALRQATVIILTLTAVTAVGIVLFLELLYGDRYAGAVEPALLLLPGSFAAALNAVAVSAANAIGRPSTGSVSQVAGLGVTVVGLALVLERYGIAGAAVVSTLAYGVRLAVSLVLLRRAGVTQLVAGPKDVRLALRRALQLRRSLR